MCGYNPALKKKSNIRIGIGFDAHNIQAGRRLVIGGIQIPSRQGLHGHSDADVLLHAIGDSILGALGLPDIGTLFPDTDPQYRGADSAQLLRQVLQHTRRLRWQVINVDCTLVCDQPRLAPHAAAIKERIAHLLAIKPDQVGLKAKTTEGTMLARPRRSIAALAVVLLGRS